jgi:hypothetical protein
MDDFAAEVLERRKGIAAAYKAGVPINIIKGKFRVHLRVVYSVVRDYKLPMRGYGGGGRIRGPQHSRQAMSGDPNIIGEHEVDPVCCPFCERSLPWALIKDWR